MRRLSQIMLLSCAALAPACGSELDVPIVEGPAERSEGVSACATDAAIASATANGNDGNLPANVLDGDLATRWSRKGKGSRITLALAQPSDVEGVAIAWYKGDQRKSKLTVSVSTDGASFQSVFSGSSSGATTKPEPVTFPAVAGVTHVRIVVDGNTQNLWASITEADVCAVTGGSSGSGGTGGGENGGGGGGGDPGSWLWTSDVALSVDATAKKSEPYALDPVILPSAAGDKGPKNHQILSGFYTLDGDRVRVYLDIYRKQPTISESELEFYAVRASGTENISTKYGNHGTDGFELEGQYVFGGYGVSFHQNEVQSKVEYFHNVQGSEKSYALPKPLQSGKLYGYKVAKENVGNEVWMNAWVDYVDGNGWVHVMKDRKWTKAGWNPGNVPPGKDEKAIEQGVYTGVCLHWWIRANGGGTVKWQGAKIREL